MVGYLKLTNNLSVPITGIDVNYITPSGSDGSNVDCFIALDDNVDMTQLNTALQSLLSTTIQGLEVYAQLNDPDPIWTSGATFKINNLAEHIAETPGQGNSAMYASKTLGLDIC